MTVDLPGKDSDELRAWLSQDMTRAIARDLVKKVGPAWERLLAACESTTDPNVSRAFHEFLLVKQLADIVTKGTNENARKYGDAGLGNSRGTQGARNP